MVASLVAGLIRAANAPPNADHAGTKAPPNAADNAGAKAPLNAGANAGANAPPREGAASKLASRLPPAAAGAHSLRPASGGRGRGGGPKNVRRAVSNRVLRVSSGGVGGESSGDDGSGGSNGGSLDEPVDSSAAESARAQRAENTLHKDIQGGGIKMWARGAGGGSERGMGGSRIPAAPTGTLMRRHPPCSTSLIPRCPSSQRNDGHRGGSPGGSLGGLLRGSGAHSAMGVGEGEGAAPDVAALRLFESLGIGPGDVGGGVRRSQPLTHGQGRGVTPRGAVRGGGRGAKGGAVAAQWLTGWLRKPSSALRTGATREQRQRHYDNAITPVLPPSLAPLSGALMGVRETGWLPTHPCITIRKWMLDMAVSSAPILVCINTLQKLHQAGPGPRQMSSSTILVSWASGGVLGQQRRENPTGSRAKRLSGGPFWKAIL